MSNYKEYMKAKESCDKVEEQFNRAKKEKDNAFENFKKHLFTLAFTQAKKTVEIPDYYLTGGGKVVFYNWELKKDGVEVTLGYLAEDDRWPDPGSVVKLPLSVLE